MNNEPLYLRTQIVSSVTGLWSDRPCFGLCNHIECNRDRTGGVSTRYRYVEAAPRAKVNRFGLPVLAQPPTVAVAAQPAPPDPLATDRNLAVSLAPRLPGYRTRKGEP